MEAMKQSVGDKQEVISKKEKKIEVLESEIQKLKGISLGWIILGKTQGFDEEKLKMVNEITSLKVKLKDARKESHLFMGKFDEAKILKEIKNIITENEHIRDFAREIKSELEYGRQRENKLMYFLYVLQKRDYPVYEIFEADIKAVPTHRFSTSLDEEYKKLYDELNPSRDSQGKTKRFGNNENLDNSNLQSLLLEDGPKPLPQKPEMIPELDLKDIIEKNSSRKVKKHPTEGK